MYYSQNLLVQSVPFMKNYIKCFRSALTSENQLELNMPKCINPPHIFGRIVDMETATLAGGCFWCTEAIFKRLKGVVSVTPGYSGGTAENPSYQDVCNGTTGHAEAIQITFDPSIISYERLLEVLWHLHDPTTPNQQGADVGTQYRSEIFYHSAKQKKTSENLKEKLDKSGAFSQPIVTKITTFTNFYKAENYHKNYYDRNKSPPYCQISIDPKIQKLMSNYKEDVKEEYKKTILA